ncbi:MAG: metallo cofactor biosynthesis protein [Candidatus Ozemobacter sibiricus]|uniref:Metallo cofactor biosynthesis protein n=1 Tax=Candidatus Ozemobacter sibiricus TaxID=2268124 RepID=A0A367ZJL0_9BACT|nr:MAG: metallo cofactor biosynthesis protein [Candidatus Ozemobacter sibiricus]
MLGDWWRRVRRWLSRWRESRAGAATIILEIVRQCNQRCRYCYRLPASAGPARHLAPAELDLILTRLRDHFGRLRLTISGGEPTLHPELMAMVRRCAAIDPQVQLITNLQTMTPARAHDLAQAGLRHLQVTFLSPVAAEHDRLCGPGSFGNWLHGLEAARRAGLQVGAILLVTRSTVGHLEQSLAFLVALGMHGFLVNRYNAGYPPSDGAEDLFLTAEDLEGFLTTLEEAGRRWNIHIPLGVPIPSCLVEFARFPHLEFSACPIGRAQGMYWAVGADGELRACNHLPGGLGSLLTARVADLLAGEAWRSLLADLERPPPACLGCPTFGICRGGCRGAAVTWSGSLRGLDPWVERLLAERRAREGRS